MAITTIADVWAPDIWIKGANEAFKSTPALWNSPVVARNPEFDQLAEGGGLTVNVPFFKDITDQDDEIQVEDTTPTILNQPTGTQIAPVLNRVSANGVTALAAAVSGDDPVGAMTSQIGVRRQKQRQKTGVAILRGIFGTALSSMSQNSFVEIVGNQTAAHFIDSDMIIDAFSLLGEVGDKVIGGGALFLHPTIRAALVKQDENNFERISEGGFLIERYKGIQLFASNLLVRAGTTSGLVYDTYLLAPRSFAYGEKAQKGDVIDVASLQYDEEKGENNAVIYDRTRFLLHPNGMAFTGTPSGQSATNAELQTAASWSLRYQSADRVGMVRIQTNG